MLIKLLLYSTRIITDSKQLTSELKKNRDRFGNGDIFMQKNIDLINNYLVNTETYLMKDVKKVSHPCIINLTNSTK